MNLLLKFQKRLFDVVFSAIGLICFGWLIIILIFLAYFDTSKGLFLQSRIGQFGKPFKIYKMRSMHFKTDRISTFGRFLRKSKLDELPQLYNILIGDMSFVGPRPDIAGYYDLLQDENRMILELKPGLCSLAAIKYYNEDEILSIQENPLSYNDEVIFPDKVKMNLHYYYNHTFWGDIKILVQFFSSKIF